MKLHSKIIILCVFFYNLQSCTDLDVINEVLKEENQDFQKWKGAFKMPMGYMSYKSDDVVEELLKGASLTKEVDADGFYTLKYSKKLSPDKKSFDIPNPKPFNQRITLPPAIASVVSAAPGGNYTVIKGDPVVGDKRTESDKLEDLKFSKDFSKAFFKQGQVVIDFTSTSNAAVAIEVTIPSLKNKTTGAAYSITIDFTKPGTKTEFVELKDYELNLTYDRTTKTYKDGMYNQFYVKTNTTFKFKAGDVIKSSDVITYEVSFANFKASLVYGDFKDDRLKVTKQTVSLFETKSGKVVFADPKLIVTYENKYGADIGMELSGIQGIHKDGTKTILNYRKDKNQLIFQKATHTGTILTAKTETITIDKTNSNFKDLVGKSKKIDMDVSGVLNPNAKKGVANKNFYDTDNSDLKADIVVSIPLELTLEDFEITKIFNFSDISKQMEHVKEFDMVFYMKNGMPFEGALHIQFLDVSGTQLLDKTIDFESTKTFDSKGRVEKELEQKKKANFKEAEAEKFKKTRKIKVVAKLKNLGTNPVKILKNSDLEINIGINAKVDYKKK